MPEITRSVVVHVCITLALVSLNYVQSDPIQLNDDLQSQSTATTMDQQQQQQILEQIIRYSQHDNLLRGANTDAASYSSLADFSQQNSDAIFDAVVQNEELCQSLNLDSPQCAADCVHYTSPLTILQDITNETDGTVLAEAFRVLGWFQMGGGPIGWFETGNPDMCSYQQGTYCYTPLSIVDPATGFEFNIQKHGCCVPGSCVGEDAEKVLRENGWCYGGYDFTYNQLLFGGMLEIDPVCEPLPRETGSAGFVLTVGVFIVFLLCVIIASFRTQQLIELEERTALRYGQKLSGSGDADTTGASEKPKTKRNVWEDHWFLYAFSIQNLWRTFTRRRPADKSDFNFLDGIRVASMSWVIWGHVYTFYLFGAPSNQAVIVPFMQEETVPYDDYVFSKVYTQLAQYGFFSVDSFFFLSGFLATFGIYRGLARFGSKALQLWHVWVPMVYVNRVLRLVPMMFFALCVQWFVADQIPYGYHVSSRSLGAEMCEDNWYKVMFFYANLMPGATDQGCMGHLWYLQCDLQMFMILPFIVMAFKWKRAWGLAFAMLLFLVGVAVRTYFAVHYHFGANFLLPATEFINGGDQREQYFKPWGRMSPYYIGVFAMLLILTLKDLKFQIRGRRPFFSLMTVACFILAALVFWPYEDVKDAPEERWSLVSNQVYYALSRPAWGAALGIMAFALVFKSNLLRSLIGTLLSCEIWQPLGKLTFSMYLIHMMVLTIYYADLEIALYYELWGVLGIFCSVWLVTMLFAMLLWFVMEQPIANLVGLGMKALMARLSKKGPSSKNKDRKGSGDSELARVASKQSTAGRASSGRGTSRVVRCEKKNKYECVRVNELSDA